MVDLECFQGTCFHQDNLFRVKEDHFQLSLGEGQEILPIILQEDMELEDRVVAATEEEDLDLVREDQEVEVRKTLEVRCKEPALAR